MPEPRLRAGGEAPQRVQESRESRHLRSARARALRRCAKSTGSGYDLLRQPTGISRADRRHPPEPPGPIPGATGADVKDDRGPEFRMADPEAEADRGLARCRGFRNGDARRPQKPGRDFGRSTVRARCECHRSAALGGRLPLEERSALSEPQQQLYDRMAAWVVPWGERAGFATQTSDGRFIGPFNPVLQSPVIGGSFLAFQAAEEKNTSLTRRVRQVVILAVGAVWGSAYEVYAHSAAARTAGLPAEVVGALAVGQLPGQLSAAEQAAWRFTHQLTTQRRVEQPLYDQAHAVFGTRGIIDMLSLIGAYQTVCGVLNALEIPAPPT